MSFTSKHLYIILVILIVVSIGATYYRIFVARDYIVQAEIDCDPKTESCFVYICDPEEEECTGDIEEDTWYYKLISKKAANIDICDPEEEECEELFCEEGEENCEITNCNSAELGEEEECVGSNKEEDIFTEKEDPGEINESPEQENNLDMIGYNERQYGSG